MINIPVTLEQLIGEHGVRPVPGVLRYDSNDPYAATLSMSTPEKNGIAWTVARDLLADGLIRPAGEGDVLIRPCSDVTEIVLNSDEGVAVLHADTQRIAAFLTLTYAAVPRGREADAVDIGAELDRIFGEAA